MNKEDLQHYIYQNIPLSKAMGVLVCEAGNRSVILEAPLLSNLNHKRTAFGGSLHSLATLACWSLVYMNLKDKGLPLEIVISKSEINYLAPVTSDFKAECYLDHETEITHFLETLLRKGKARIRLNAHIFQGETRAVDYWGDFAVVKV